MVVVHIRVGGGHMRVVQFGVSGGTRESGLMGSKVRGA